MTIIVTVGPPRTRTYAPDDGFPTQRFEFPAEERRTAEAFADQAALEGYDVKMVLR